MAAEIDLKKEQEATLARPRRPYGMLAKLLFWGMDVFYGEKLTLGKMRFLEILARIPYQAWEFRHYHRLSRKFSDPKSVEESEDVIRWGRDAQDNEFWHLQVVNEKIKEEGFKLGWFKDKFAPTMAAFQYDIFCRFLALIKINKAYLLNAEFEDHAEHEYMTYVKDHPELDEQPVDSGVAGAFTGYGELRTWGDVFRSLGLNEREHMNNSLVHCGRGAEVAPFPSG